MASAVPVKKLSFLHKRLQEWHVNLNVTKQY